MPSSSLSIHFTKFARLINPSNPAATLQPRHRVCIRCWQRRQQEEELLAAEAVEKPPHPLHQYCSLTWWKLTPANIFHHVIGRKDQVPWLDMPTLLSAQIMTQNLLHYSRPFSKIKKQEDLEGVGELIMFCRADQCAGHCCVWLKKWEEAERWKISTSLNKNTEISRCNNLVSYVHNA